MKICIPTQDDQELASSVHPHFGRAPFLSIVDVDTGKLQVVKNPQCHDHPHSCHHLPILKSHDVDTVVCTGIGHRALENLRAAGIQVLWPPIATVEGVIEAVRAGQCSPYSPSQHGLRHGRHGCRHGSGSGHAHGHAARRGAGRHGGQP